MSQSVYIALLNRFEALESTLNKLDAATGDGDHGTTMLKGMRAIQNSSESPAKAFRRAAGGASGSLFSLLIAGIEKITGKQTSVDDALSEAATRINQIGQAVAGDKTMLDALIPASACQNLKDAAQAARQGVLATEEMSAKRGRARYVEGAGVGHVDAGATSVAEILEIVAEYSKAND